MNIFPQELLYVIIPFLDKPYQEINFKNHSNSVLLCK